MDNVSVSTRYERYNRDDLSSFSTSLSMNANAGY